MTTKKKSEKAAPPLPPNPPNSRLVYKDMFTPETAGRLEMEVWACKDQSCTFRFLWRAGAAGDQRHSVTCSYDALVQAGDIRTAISITSKLVHDPKFASPSDHNKIAGWCALFPCREFILALVLRGVRIIPLLP